MDTKANDAARKLIHHHKHPVALYKDGFAAEQINTPEAVFCVSREGQPRWLTTRSWPVIGYEDTSDNIFINTSGKGTVDLLGDPWAAKTWVASF